MKIDFGAVVDALPGLVWTTRADGRSDFVNCAWREYTGLGSDEGWQTAIHPEDLTSFVQSWKRIEQSGIVREIDARLRRFDGQYRWFVFRPSPLPKGDSPNQRWCWLGLDADESATTDGRLRRLFDMMPVQAGFLNTAMVLEFANLKSLKDFNMTFEQLDQWTRSGIIHADDHENNFRYIKAVLAGEASDTEIRMLYPDGVYRWTAARCLPVRDAQGNVVRYVTCQIDVDDLKRAEALLAAEVKLLEMVARGEPLEQVLEALSLHVEELCSGCFCSVLRVAPDRKHFRIDTGSSSPVAWHDIFNGKTIDSSDDPCSLAVIKKAPVMSSLGLGLCCAMPIISASGDVSGVVAIYRSKPVATAPKEEDLLDRFTKIAGIAIDRAAADTALRDRERELREALAQLSEGQRISKTGSFTSDIQHDRHRWSDEFYRIFEIDPETPPRLEAVRARIHPEDVHVFDSEIQRRIEGSGGEFDFRAVTPQGGLKHLRAAAHVMEHVAGRPIFVGTVQDITKSKLSEEELQRSEAYLAEGQRLAKTGSYLWLPNTNQVPFFSAEMLRIFGFEDRVPSTMEEIFSRIHPDDLPRANAAIEVSRSGHDIDFIFRLQMPDGSIKFLRSFIRAAQVRGGHLELMGTVQDITESKLAEEALNQTRSELAHVARVATLNAMTASIAHEVSQPLSGILTNANTCVRMLAANPPNVAVAAETARRTIRDANRATEVIQRLRAMFSTKAATMDMADLNEVAREVIALSMGELQRAGALLQTDFARELPQVRVDRVQLQQVILNLLLNAADAMAGIDDRPRTLLVRTGLQDDGTIRLLVRDSGTGIDPAKLDRLFEAFYTTKAKGMGVGLSISRSIIERHGGRLWAENNDAPGATFSFSIPSA